MTDSRDDILTTVSRLVVEVAGDDILLTGPITLATSFNADLELESIEFVALAEKLQQHYGGRVDFVGWISAKELDAIIALTVGELVEFIASCRS
jgi:acyl carrier protein